MNDTRLRVIAFGMLLAPITICGCGGALNPAFVELAGGASTPDNAPGHVPIQLINNVEVDEQLINYLEQQGLQLTDAEKRALRPRLRMRVQVVFSTGATTEFEFVEGSKNLIDPSFDPQAFPDLVQNDLDNAVMLCDVALMQITNVDVFVPVELRGYELVTINVGGDAATRFELRETIPPQFRQLQVDQVDEDGNTVLQANVPVRRAPSPAESPVCGSVIAVVVTGALQVPFLTGVDDAPSYDRQDPNSVASIGGRYEFTVAIQ